MRHDWIYDVLRDLRDYAQRNGLSALAEQADIALRVAQSEIAASELTAGGEPGDSPDTPPRPLRRN